MTHWVKLESGSRLGLNAELERQMNTLVGTYFDEWKAVVESPEKVCCDDQIANVLIGN